MDLGKWLDDHGWPITVFEERLARAFVDERQGEGRSPRSQATTLRQFLAHLRVNGVVAAAPSPPLLVQSPLTQLLEQYEKHLRAERGLSAATVSNYVPPIGRFLKERFGEGPLLPTELMPADGARFILGHASTMSPGRARLLVTALRSFWRVSGVRRVAGEPAPSDSVLERAVKRPVHPPDGGRGQHASVRVGLRKKPGTRRLI